MTPCVGQTYLQCRWAIDVPQNGHGRPGTVSVLSESVTQPAMNGMRK
ncbi:hypothetical protein GL213_05350 [Halogeometricum borinquense]|uniref:Uncharacterized protein n=1 Tax=Halogeometricum borinquense TaxID=60847 RepID=A0A6C0UC19_9EURY|nr:hypothetical protein [Halogeometricum borinquense]QIB72802.1 hypothetical protein G3I44_12480 [Halogeometricum borinquense]QIQ75059.1 hypothetical protein GL213_05350 [Halogeometricum borinquense]